MVGEGRGKSPDVTHVSCCHYCYTTTLTADTGARHNTNAHLLLLLL